MSYSVSNWSGRLGNNIQQVANCIMAAEKNKTDFTQTLDHDIITKFTVNFGSDDKEESGRFYTWEALVNCENDPGNTIVAFYKNGTKSATQTIGDASIGTNTTIFDNINTAPGLGSAADRTFSQGDILSVSINPANAPGEVQVTTVWSYTVGP